MARIADIVHDVILFEEALGTRLWEFAPDEKVVPGESGISMQLREFAEATTRLGLIHGDLRPWNVIVGATLEIKVIDWGLSCFVDELPKRVDLTRQPGHYWCFSGGRPVEQLDLTDADRISRLMRGEITYTDAWKQNPPSWLPHWCRPPGC
jgi:aminoglycoside phosphotransferase (APT) family kinase protein